ncbi:hypothetical protein MTR67_021349 [Solanum verrucosum]|uniref:Uncharacterized protein n=1 Tax=Solanum verrucosum TaxID=315347 RepID=A0AAF0QXX0_SOLVR|nr:hypothetical protein MTR67_021349 [Solanum verrucosum]
MGKNTSAKGKEKKEAEHNEQDGFSVLSPCKPASSHKEEQSQVELEIRLLEALEIYPLAKLRGIHRHFVLFGLTENLRRSLRRQFTPDDVLKLLDRFYDINMVEEQSQVELEIRLLEALEIYPLAKLRGIHRHLVLYGLTENLYRRLLDYFCPFRLFSSSFSGFMNELSSYCTLREEIRNLRHLKSEDEDAEIFNREEVFCLPYSYFSMEEP